MLVLKMVNRHLAKLTRKYTATQKGDLRALAIAEELSQVGDETHELATTTKYMRTVEERIRYAVENLGGDSMAANGRETSDLANLQNLNALAKALTNHGYFKGNVGGGGRSRTYDAADMSRVL
jgi:hypothetical protein